MNLLESFKPISTLIFDMDGVLTDGTVWVFENGEQVRRMSIKDGYALQLAVKKNYRILIISGGNGIGAEKRLRNLGIQDVFMKVTDKIQQVEEWLQKNKINWSETLYMGDDMPDYPVMKKAGMPCAPADAAPEILQAARYISPYGGGKGCVRDVVEKLLRLHGNWDQESGIPSR